MSNNLFISYDLNSPGQKYQVLIDAIPKLGIAIHLQKSFFYLKTNFSEEYVSNYLSKYLDINDSLIVVTASSSYFSGKAGTDYLPSVRNLWNK